jgi:thioredoxin reductase (NADPH)
VLIYDLAVIGAGPSGVGAVYEAVQNGVESIALFEKGDSPLTTVQQFYKDGKRVDSEWKGKKAELLGTFPFVDGTKESTIELFQSKIDSDKIDKFFGSEVEKIIRDEEKFEIVTADRKFHFAKNVIIAIGNMGKPNKPKYKIPPAVKKIVNFNSDNSVEGEKTLVVGGGNSAVEYAVSLSESRPVTLVYRGDEFLRVNHQNIKDIHRAKDSNGMHLKMATDIVELKEAENGVKVIYSRAEPEIYDRIIYAIGGTAPVDFLKKCEVPLSEKGVPIYNGETMMISPHLYIAGDVALQGGGSIAIGLNHSYLAVKDILESL